MLLLGVTTEMLTLPGHLLCAAKAGTFLGQSRMDCNQKEAPVQGHCPAALAQEAFGDIKSQSSAV